MSLARPVYRCVQTCQCQNKNCIWSCSHRPSWQNLILGCHQDWFGDIEQELERHFLTWVVIHKDCACIVAWSHVLQQVKVCIAPPMFTKRWRMQPFRWISQVESHQIQFRNPAQIPAESSLKQSLLLPSRRSTLQATSTTCLSRTKIGLLRWKCIHMLEAWRTVMILSSSTSVDNNFTRAEALQKLESRGRAEKGCCEQPLTLRDLHRNVCLSGARSYEGVCHAHAKMIGKTSIFSRLVFNTIKQRHIAKERAGKKQV